MGPGGHVANVCVPTSRGAWGPRALMWRLSGWLDPLGSLGLAEVNQPFKDDHADREDAERPPRMGTADIEQRLDRAKRGGDGSDHLSEQACGEQREGGCDLDRAEDDRYPAPRMQPREDELRIREERLVVERRDAVDDVENSCDQQEDPHK